MMAALIIIEDIDTKSNKNILISRLNKIKKENVQITI